MRGRAVLSLVFGSCLLLWGARAARACGCFAQSNAAMPVVQAGERILFSRDNGVVTAHIQIQYAGSADEFAWLLPLPSVPTLALGSDELFAQLQRQTQPSYILVPTFEDCGGGGGSGGCIGFAAGGDNAGVGSPAADGPTGGPLVVQSSIGPYDYAVLHADSSRELLDWLDANRYFVPASSDEAIKPYLRAGAHFLALRLHSGKTVGDIQPIVVKYASDLPMIPIVLTSISAQPDMGILVWMLAQGRAIPRNYAHTVINDAQLDWANGVRNYNAVIVRATREAQGRHTFVTEYAGPSSVMRGQLAPAGRFGSQQELASQPTIDAFGVYLRDKGYAIGASGVLPPLLLQILETHAPMPPGLPVPPSQFYLNIAFFRPFYAAQLAGWPESYDPEAMAAEIFERVALPLRAAEQLFAKYPVLTRLYTTLSPGDMTRDPVFTENATLPMVSNVHRATITYHCGGSGGGGPFTPATLETEQGYVIGYPDGTASPPSLAGIAASRRIESLLEEGPPGVIVDNDQAIAAALGKLPQASGDDGGCGCRVGHRGRYGGLALMALLVLWRLARRRRRS